MFSYFVLILAVLIEALLPEGVSTRAQVWVARISAEFEINATKLGAPKLQSFQWLVPVLVWVVGVFCLYQVLMDLQPMLAALLCVCVLLYGLRFKHFAEIFTSAQLFLNQGDLLRAKELLLGWAKAYNGTQPRIERSGEMVFFAIEHGTERALRQYFCILFWFWVLPGPLGLVLYLAVLRSAMDTKSRPSAAEQCNSTLVQTALRPRFVLFVMEWLPTRLLVLTIALVRQFDEVLLCWRTAKAQHPFSNRAPLVEVCLSAVGLGAGLEQLTGRDDLHVQALQQFRQLMLRCTLVWLLAALVLALLGWF